MATAGTGGAGGDHDMDLDVEIIIVGDLNSPSDNSSSSSSVQILSQSQGSSGTSGSQSRNSAPAAPASSSARANSNTSSSSTTDSGPNTSSLIGIKNEKEFLKCLECPICIETVTPPVTNCTNGHIICSICRPRLKKCGLCDAPYTNSRNFAIEGILAVVEKKCPYSPCGQKFRIDKLAKHMGICDYRPIKCFETNSTVCRGKLIDFQAYLNHLTQDHKLRIKAETYHEFKLSNIFNELPVKWPIFPFTVAGQTFLLHRAPNESNTSLRVWITALLAKDENATKYSFHVRVYPPPSTNNRRSYLEFKIRARTVHMQVKDIVEACDCLVISKELIEPYCERRPTRNRGSLAPVYAFEYKWTMSFCLVITP